MFYCTDCKEEFEEPEKIVERHTELDFPCDEVLYACPKCGSGAFYQTKQCDCCGDWIHDSYVEIDGEYYCDNCYVIRDISELNEW